MKYYPNKTNSKKDQNVSGQSHKESKVKTAQKREQIKKLLSKLKLYTNYLIDSIDLDTRKQARAEIKTIIKTLKDLEKEL